MRFKTTCKLFFANVSLVWKTFVYRLITTLISGGIAVTIALPVISKLKTAGLFKLIRDLFGFKFTTIAGLTESFYDISKCFADTISTNWNTLSANIVFFIIFAVVFYYFLNSLADIALTEVIYGQMSCNAKFGFTASYIKNMGKSSVYALIKLISVFLFDVGMVFGLYGICTLFIHIGGFNVFTPFVVLLALLLAFAFRLTIFACFVPYMVVSGKSGFKALFKGIKLGFKNFNKTYLTAFALLVLIVAVNVFVGLLTYAIGLLITLPASVVIISVFSMVIFYSNKGMYFYAGDGNIQDKTKGVKRLEEQDTVRKLKNLI